MKLLPSSNVIRDKVLALKAHQKDPADETFCSSYAQEINTALTIIVEDSFEDEYRKVEINLGPFQEYLSTMLIV